MDTNRKIRLIFGGMLIAGGISVIADYYLHTGWLKLAVVLVAGLYLLYDGMKLHRVGFLVAGGILCGLTAGLWLAFSGDDLSPVRVRVGEFFSFCAAGWLLVPLLSIRIASKPAMWPLVPGAVMAALGLWLVRTPAGIFELVLYMGVALALAFIGWGIVYRLFGLIIPGCLLLGIGLGLYEAWGVAREPNGLVQTGTMLVWFALGWGLIVLFGRILMDKLVWWPLIPGGVLAMTGWGLYIGGSPDNALYFISNSGSIGLIIVGLYLLLLKKGIQ
jgi:hypothetical protein